jgi:4-diphosphocytidyl-2-C-methyl-D-erythritol kinase
VGDELEPLGLPALPLVLLLPSSGLSTAEVYRTFDGVATQEPLTAFKERRRRTERAWKTVAAAWASGGLDDHALRFEVARLMSNDLEKASVHLLPELAVSRAELDEEDVLGTLMSGSGPTLFALCASGARARAVAGRLRDHGLSARAVMTVGEPPR